ncbi:MAG TPA: ubiquinone biosynthesis protein UbiB [Planctomycetes bacterium]|jgi:ubiquinone biosynthesis protein|nr:ubiquinone biosynthesis protein UbiB [Planctomycetota bacterium]HIL52313.1 ubiquinone biosynthesis protein UbiB [Planctomycetota bacterium]
MRPGEPCCPKAKKRAAFDPFPGRWWCSRGPRATFLVVLINVLIAAEDFGRLREITQVLVEFGFKDLVQRMGLLGFLHRAGSVLHWETVRGLEELPAPHRVRLAIEKLGPTFVKLGQLLASRGDLLPPEYIDELSHLQSGVGTVPFEDLRSQLTQDLGRPPEEVFSDLDIEPFAAGSIGQVHRAQLPDGRDVILKIRRPGIEKKVRADLRLLERLAEILEKEVIELRRFRPQVVVRQFSRSLKAELDFSVEARNTEQIARNLRDSEDLVIPEVFGEFSCTRLVVQEFLDGHSAAAWIRGNHPPGLDPERIASIGADTILRMVFDDGFYHADPHPGNVLFLPEGQVGLLDFGMVGRLSVERRQQFVLMLAAIIDRDEDGLVDTLLEWSDGAEIDIDALAQDCSAFLDRYIGHELKDLDVAGMLRDITSIVRENNLVLPADVAMLIKVFLTLEGLGRRLDPSFSLDEHLEPVARRMIRRVSSPQRIIQSNWKDLRRLMVALPRDLRRLVMRARRGGLRIELDLKRLDDFGQQLDRSANRVTVGLITAALIVGTSISMTIDSGPMLMGLPVLGLIGFGTSFSIGLMLLWSILRSGHR